MSAFQPPSHPLGAHAPRDMVPPLQYLRRLGHLARLSKGHPCWTVVGASKASLWWEWGVRVGGKGLEGGGGRQVRLCGEHVSMRSLPPPRCPLPASPELVLCRSCGHLGTRRRSTFPLCCTGVSGQGIQQQQQHQHSARYRWMGQVPGANLTQGKPACLVCECFKGEVGAAVSASMG